MKHILWIFIISSTLTLYGCSSDKTSEAPQKSPAFALSLADKEKLVAFQKELLSVESLADKAVKMAGDELKNVIKGGEISIDLPSIIDKAKAECLLAGEVMTKKAVPEALPPEVKTLIEEGKVGLASAYKAYAESFDAIRRFVADKNPMALLEYRKKSSQAQELFNSASEKFKMIMAAAGVSQ